jgi:hypothetical protein
MKTVLKIPVDTRGEKCGAGCPKLWRVSVNLPYFVCLEFETPLDGLNRCLDCRAAESGLLRMRGRK